MKFLKLTLFSTMFALLAGCSGYKMGSNLPEQYQTVFVVVQNESSEPSVEVQATKAMMAEVQMDGRLALCSRADADTILEVTVFNYYLSALNYDRDHGARAQEYRVNVSAKAVFYDADTGEVLREVPSVTGQTDFPYDSDLTSGKRAALLDASGDLARQLISQTISAW